MFSVTTSAALPELPLPRMQNRIAIWIACDEATRSARANTFLKQIRRVRRWSEEKNFLLASRVLNFLVWLPLAVTLRHGDERRPYNDFSVPLTVLVHSLTLAATKKASRDGRRRAD